MESATFWRTKTAITMMGKKDSSKNQIVSFQARDPVSVIIGLESLLAWGGRPEGPPCRSPHSCGECGHHQHRKRRREDHLGYDACVRYFEGEASLYYEQGRSAEGQSGQD